MGNKDSKQFLSDSIRENNEQKVRIVLRVSKSNIIIHINYSNYNYLHLFILIYINFKSKNQPTQMTT